MERKPHNYPRQEMVGVLEMIIKKNELKAKTSEYIREMIAKAEDYVADKIIKASSNREYKVRIGCPDDIPWWALEEVGMKYQDEGYTTDFTMHSLWIVIDDEAYRKKQEDSKRDWGWDL